MRRRATARPTSARGKHTYDKIAVSIPHETAVAARERVAAGEAPSMSALVAQALEEKLEKDDLQGLLEEMDRELGPVSEEKLAWADSVLDRLRETSR